MSPSAAPGSPCNCSGCVEPQPLRASDQSAADMRWDTGADCPEYVKGLMTEQGIANPTDAEIHRFDRQLKGKKVSNKDGESPADPVSHSAKMKDGTTHLTSKAEQALDLNSGFVLAVTVHAADQADPTTLVYTVLVAQINLVRAGSDQEVEAAVADKGYHKAETLAECGWRMWRNGTWCKRRHITWG